MGGVWLLESKVRFGPGGRIQEQRIWLFGWPVEACWASPGVWVVGLELTP
jgi:hypothetical protein